MKRVLPWIAVMVGLLAVGALAGRPVEDGPPLDPASTGPAGTKALVEILRALGGDVSVRTDTPGPDDDVALVLADDLDDAGRDRLSAWVDSGGTLILTDPVSSLSPARPAGEAGFGILEPELLAGCEMPALDRLDRVSVPGAVLLDVPEGAIGCFPGGRQSWLVEAAAGRGRILVLGGPGAFVNGELAEADNALLAATLMVPTRSERVVVLAPPVPGGGRKGLAELIPLGVKLALVQLALAFVVFAAGRARRLGMPVSDPLPVPIPASELVTAVGQLNQRARARRQAAAVLRGDLRRTLTRRFGLPADTPAPVLAEVAVTRSARTLAAESLSAEEVVALLDGPIGGMTSRASGGDDVADERSLVELARSIELVRRRVTGG